MSYPESENLCYICFVSEEPDLIHCDKCNVPIHKSCIELFNLEKGGTLKKVKLEKSIYSRIRKFEQLENPLYKEWFTGWLCDRCHEGGSDKIFCDFCHLRDGFLVKVKFNQQEKKKGRKSLKKEIENKWAHLNCVLKIYGQVPTKDPQDKCYMLERDELADAPECKRCGSPFKMDVKCKSCDKFYAHNLCINEEKMQLKICNACDKVDDVQETLDSNSSGIYMQKFMQGLVDSEKYNDFCLNKEKNPPKEQSARLSGRKKTEESKKMQGEEKEEVKLSDHFLRYNDKNELIYAFPFATKDLYFKNENPIETSKNVQENLETQIDATLSKIEGDNLLSSQNEPLLEVGNNFEPPLVLGEIEVENSGEKLSDLQNNLKMEEIMTITDQREIDLNQIKSNEEDFKTEIKNEDVTSNSQKPKKKIFNIIRTKVKYEPKKGLDLFAKKVEDWHYISSIQILKELQKIYMDNIIGKEEIEKIRLTKKWYELLEDLQDKATSSCLKTYDEKMAKEIADKFSLYAKYRVQCDTWPLIPQTYRKYEEVEDYKPGVDTESFRAEINKTLRSKKTHKCPLNCKCSNLETLGPYLVDKMTWETCCPGRAQLMECDENCGCDLSVCKNRSISTGQRKKLTKDLKETFCWGIDYATHNNILLVLPEYKEIDKNDFIETKLLRAVHLTNTPWDMTAVCKQIIKESKSGNKMFTKIDRKLAKMLVKAIKFVNNFDTSAFRLHTKGYGVVCINEEGIAANDMIAEYFGEIYTPWRWFEKQDLIKKYCKEKDKKDELPDFYNIMLEKHKDDPDGYDILIIDPINKGNYSSRLSHSCDPNCGTVTTVANGKYGVAMYSLKDISYGEELTFDYYSVTENEKEYKQAICLCGSRNCKIHYLNLLSWKNQNSYLERNLTFIEENHLICLAGTEPLTSDDNQLLEHYSARGSMLDGCPTWLKKWTALILRFIEEEKQEYVNFTLPKRKQEIEFQNQRRPLDHETLMNLKKHLHLEKLSLESDRIQNLTITINKVKHVLNLIKDKYGKSAALLRSQNKPFINIIPRIKQKSKKLEVKVEEPLVISKLPKDDNLPRASFASVENPPAESSYFPPEEFFDLNFKMPENITQEIMEEEDSEIGENSQIDDVIKFEENSEYYLPHLEELLAAPLKKVELSQVLNFFLIY